MLTNPTSTMPHTHTRNSLDQTVHAPSIVTHRSHCATTNTRQTHCTSTRARPCAQPTSHTATHKHPHNSSSQRTNSDTTKHCHSCGMRVVTFRDACQPHTGKPNTSLASNTHHHLACRDCVCRGVPQTLPSAFTCTTASHNLFNTGSSPRTTSFTKAS